MAQPVPFRKFVPTDNREDITRKVEAAPTVHGEALLSGYALLQQLHDTGTLDLLRGLFGAGDAVVNHVVDVASAPEMVNLLRSGLALGALVASIDPDELDRAIKGSPEERRSGPPSLWKLGKMARTEEARLGLGVGLRLLTLLGTAVKKQRSQSASQENSQPNQA